MWRCALFPEPVIYHYNPLLMKELVTVLSLLAQAHTEG